MSSSMRDVARESGVSIYTVSNVINNKKTVKAETRQKVIKAIRHLNYDPARNILQTGARKVNTLGLVLPQIFDAAQPSYHTFYYRAVMAAMHHTAAAGYSCTLFSEQDITEKTVTNFHVGQAQLGCDGLIIFCPNGNWNQYVDNLLKWNVPVVLIRRPARKRGLVTIHDDDYRGGRLAVEHLADAGHKTIAMVCNRTDYPESPRHRLQAYTDVLCERNLCADPRLVVRLPEHGKNPGARIRELRAEGLPVTAAFCQFDTIAAETIRSLAASGLRVPDDVAVVGFDNDIFTGLYNPAITTVNIPVEEMVGAACRSLIAERPDDNGITADMEFENTLVVRDSCGTSEKEKG